MKATPSSKKKIRSKEKNKINEKKKRPFIKPSKIKLEIIKTKVWPAVILALNRIDKLKDLIFIEKISTNNNNNKIKKGTSGI
jgi:hypothetical protein